MKINNSDGMIQIGSVIEKIVGGFYEKSNYG